MTPVLKSHKKVIILDVHWSNSSSMDRDQQLLRLSMPWTCFLAQASGLWNWDKQCFIVIKWQSYGPFGTVSMSHRSMNPTCIAWPFQLQSQQMHLVIPMVTLQKPKVGYGFFKHFNWMTLGFAKKKSMLGFYYESCGCQSCVHSCAVSMLSWLSATSGGWMPNV